MFDQELMALAWSVSERGTCSRRYVGVVIAGRQGELITTGANGALNGFLPCGPHDDYQPCDTGSHAERNAIYEAARWGYRLNGSIMYTTDSPCVACAKAIIQSGIIRVVYSRTYREDKGLFLLLEGGRVVERMVGPEDTYRHTKLSVWGDGEWEG